MIIGILNVRSFELGASISVIRGASDIDFSSKGWKCRLFSNVSSVTEQTKWFCSSVKRERYRKRIRNGSSMNGVIRQWSFLPSSLTMKVLDCLKYPTLLRPILHPLSPFINFQILQILLYIILPSCRCCLGLSRHLALSSWSRYNFVFLAMCPPTYFLRVRANRLHFNLNPTTY